MRFKRLALTLQPGIIGALLPRRAFPFPARCSPTFSLQGPPREPVVSDFPERAARRHRTVPGQQPRPYAARARIVRYAYRQARAAAAAIPRRVAPRYGIRAAVVLPQT